MAVPRVHEFRSCARLRVAGDGGHEGGVRTVTDDNVVSGVQFGRKRASDTASSADPARPGRDDAIDLLVEGTGVLADALTTLAAGTPDNVRAQALRARCEALTRLIQDQVKAMAARRGSPPADGAGAPGGSTGRGDRTE